ncbi:hypothetical protein J1TS1_35710 [Shouchella clausii]|uniref:restriction endonuclease subunit S n=1 Tax=Shouchella clausii TaxID=79880 RepID=UPI00079655FD|nr:restriction endonuclease subunit S [Shouchella clausii]KKI84829.1 hypothetical protein WZ76_18435 [Shouchella clausii]GIN09426.1 hypothetical protein J1TS1_35710 [Shouchella clausii]
MHNSKIKLGEIVKMDSGYAFKSTYFNNEIGIPVIRIRDVNSGVSETLYSGDYQEKYIVNNGDILITMDGEFNIREWMGGKALLNQRVCRIKGNNELILDRYLLYVMPAILKKIEAKTPFATVKHLSIKDLANIELSLPTLDTQKKIVQILDQAKSLLTKRKAQIEALDQLTQSVFLEMFGDPVINNKGWNKEKLSLTGELKRGMSKHRPRNAPELLGGPYPLIQTGDVSKSGLYIKDYTQTYSELGLKQSKMWPEGTLCITIAANIARTGILTFDACFPDSVVAYLPGSNMSNIYVHYWFSFLQRIIESNAPESAQKNINLKILSDLEIPIPPQEEQRRFEKIVLNIEKQRELFEIGLSELQNNFNSIIQRAFKGELFTEEKLPTA